MIGSQRPLTRKNERRGLYRDFAIAGAGIIRGLSITVGVAMADTNPASQPFPGPTTQEQHTVQSFNDGFATSKQDDCQQGFEKACDWLKGK